MACALRYFFDVRRGDAVVHEDAHDSFSFLKLLLGQGLSLFHIGGDAVLLAKVHFQDFDMELGSLA
jgi:hypothetical protein